MKGFGIYVKNDLLEPKHIQNMGEAVWLYLWLLDKMTSVNENGIGKVLGNQPITHDLVAIELGIPLRTYRRWVNKLRDTGYIHTTRTPYGLIIVISKATKRFKKVPKRSATSGTSSSATNGTSLIPEMGQIVSSDVPQSVQRSAKLAHVIKTKQDITKTKQYGDKSPGVIDTMYYQVIKKYALPVRNHNNVKAAIKKLAGEVSTEDGEVYLRFLLDKYQSLQFSHKPELNEALDIQAKRLNIINAVKRAASKHQGTIKI